MADAPLPQGSESTHSVSMVQSPPRTVGGTLARLGPGLIIAGSIVGSGELIATTKTGADAGIWLLWLIVIGCVIKVFVQCEFGRFTITEGRTSMDGMNLVPGPRLRVSWLVWYWVLMFTVGMGQLGGIVGGVGQSLALTMEISGDFNRLHEEQDTYDNGMRPPVEKRLVEAERRQAGDSSAALDEEAQARIEAAIVEEIGTRPNYYTWDDVIYSGLVTLITVVLLVNGRYGMIQTVAAGLVAAFTGLTVFNLFALQSQQQWSVDLEELARGFSFRLPPAGELGTSPLTTALATFGIIGVGASELVAYPYWCLEKGYARFTGKRSESGEWAVRANGWLRVMRWDAWGSMVVYTLATVAFYLLGSSVLHREGLSPEGNRMISTLAQMYKPVFGVWAAWVFLFGAIAVLYSTFFVATAGNARMATDALRVFRFLPEDEASRLRMVRILSGVFPVISFMIYAIVKKPVVMVLVSGMAQSIMLPMLGGAALYFRYRRCDARITPGRAWDAFLWVSVAGLLIAGGYGAWAGLGKLVDQIAAIFG